MEFHPIANEYPLMPEAELQRLAGGMSSGFDRRFPITKFEGRILDGRNRFEAAKIAGVDPFFGPDFKGTEEEAREFVIRANEHRRHLTKEWLSLRRMERVSRVMEARAGGASTRQIAEEEGVSRAQVNRDLEAAKTTSTGPPPGPVVTPPRITGKDGRKRTATPKKKPPKSDVHAGLSIEERATDRIATQQPAPDTVTCTLCRGKGTITAKQAAAAKFVPPTLAEVQAYCNERNNDVDAEAFMAHYESNGWMVGRNKMKSWKGAVHTWERSEFSSNGTGKKKEDPIGTAQRWAEERSRR